jgi:phosphate transport system substrate-binding protein
VKAYRLVVALAICGALGTGIAACGGDDNSSSSGSSGSSSSSSGSSQAKIGGTLNGAGATFPQPVYTEWAARFKEAAGTTVNYQGIGSGGGVAQFTAGTVDFGASDAALKDDELKAASKKSEALDIPTVLGAVTVSYNVSGVQKGLKLDGATVADIFLGKITKWNDPKIASQNSGVKLPANNITVCHRSDESGTTKNFTQFLADYSPAWEKGPGVDKTVKWPTGTGAKGNDGVAACIKQNDNAVGYVEQAYALQNNFTFADVKNKAGNYVTPSLQATSAAGVGASPPADLRFSTINADGDQTYPISAVTFLLVHQDSCKAGLSAAKAKALKAWLDYALGDGQSVAKDLSYAPLPSSILDKAKAKVAGLQCNGSPISTA